MDADRIVASANRPQPAPAPPAPLPGRELPRGIRDCNPGNLRPAKQRWLGEIEPEGGYCRFSDAFFGIRALAKNLIAYQVNHDCRTIAQIITRWAPPSDNNDTASYIAAVALACGVDADDAVVLYGVDTLQRLTTAIIRHENGMQPYAAELVQNAVMQALA